MTATAGEHRRASELRKVAVRIYSEALPDLGPKGKELVDIGLAMNK